MRDTGPVSNGDERTGQSPAGTPSRERATRNPYHRQRGRAGASSAPRVTPVDDSALVPVAPLLVPVPFRTGDASAESVATTADVLASAGRELTLEGACVALVDGVTGALDLASAHLYVLEGSVAGGRLRLAANTGGHSAFMTDAAAIALDADVPVVRALLDGTPRFEGDPHGLGDPVEGGPAGVGRWRATIGAQAEAVLPLLVGGRGIGVLTLTWRAPRAFEAVDRGDLELLAAAIAPVIDPLRYGSSAQRQEAGHGPVTEVFTVDIAGRLTRGEARTRPALRIAAASGRGDDSRAAFHEVTACEDGRTIVAAGVVLATDASAVARASEAGRLLLGWMAHGLGPAASLSALAAWGAREGEGVEALDAVACVIDTGRRYASHAVVGRALVAVLAGDGRFLCDVAPARPTAQPPERMTVLLPGDRLAVWSGDAPGLTAGDGPAFVRGVIGDAAMLSADRAVAGLVGSVAAGACAAEAAIVVDSMGPQAG